MTGSPLALGALLLAPAAAQHAQHLPYFDTNLIVMEAENFTLSSGDEVGERAPSGWEAREWLHSANRFAASVADTYLSRRAYLHGPAPVDKSASATMDFELSAAVARTPGAEPEPYGAQRKPWGPPAPRRAFRRVVPQTLGGRARKAGAPNFGARPTTRCLPHVLWAG